MFCFKTTLLITIIAYECQAVQFIIRNNLPGPILVGILGNGGQSHLENGGFQLNQNQERTVHAPENWAGRFWARTYCNMNNYHCETGDCGNRLQCNGAGGAPPATLVEITLKGHGGQDFYDISLVDGFNVIASIAPENGQGNCRALSCSNWNIISQCPNELKVYGPNSQTIACNSACNKFNTDQYCCRGAFGQPHTCNTNSWPVNSARFFKDRCGDAYSYAYDDATSTFTCRAPTYRVTFG